MMLLIGEITTRESEFTQRKTSATTQKTFSTPNWLYIDVNSLVARPAILILNDIKMSTPKNRTIKIQWPILHGTISTAMAKCGQKNCRCRKDPGALHGPYFRWTGKLNGKITTRTISETEAKECGRYITNYQELMEQLEKLLEEATDSAPWMRKERK